MNFINNIRNLSFWLSDKLKGGKLKADLNDIIDTSKISSFDELLKKNQPTLKSLLKIVVENSAFYSKYRLYEKLQDFPVVNKIDIKQNFDSINILPTTSKDIKQVSSSGSTGTPFKIYQNSRKVRRNKADVIFFANAVGYNIGDLLLFMRLWLKKYEKSYLKRKLTNIVQIDVEKDLTDEKIEFLLEKLKSNKQRKGIIGYPSAYEKICNYLDKVNSSKLNLNIKSIIATSETLYDNTKQRMEYYFNAPIVSRYSNEENGIIAQQMIGDKSFTINWASYYIEILDLEKDVPAKLGELGRIVITDLYNTATPMIRYDTGDLGKFCDFENDGVPKFELITGRKKDLLYNTKGGIVNPFVFYNGLTQFSELNQFQIVQKSQNDYIFKINCDNEFKKEKELISYFMSYLGNDAKIVIEYVKEIPLLNSGKRRIIVNLYK